MHVCMSPSNKLSRPTLKRTNIRLRKRTRTDSNKPGHTAALVEPPRRLPKRARSASPVPRDPDLEPPRPRRVRRNSAGPSYDPTPYSLSVDYVDRSTGKTQDYFVETLSNHTLSNRKFKIDREANSVALKNLDQCEAPEELLVGAFARCIREMFSRYPGTIKFGVTVESTQLDYPIEVPYRTRWQNSPAALLNEFTRVSQSKQQANLYGAPLIITVTALGGHDGGSRKASDVTHNVNEKNLIKIINPKDGYCMLYAVELTRLHKALNKPGGLTSLEFHKILKKGINWNSTRGFKSKLPTMTGLVEKLFADCPRLPRGLPLYSVEEHLPLIQETYNRLYPGQFRIIAFDEFGRYQPCYKGPPAQQDICIVHHGNEVDGRAHFDGVRCVNTLFGKSYYCPDCERAFAHKIEHTGKCIRKCRGCGGFGAEYPCRGGLKIVCSDCNETFVSRECYERHIGRMCERFHKCKDCGVSYDVKAAKRLTQNKKHECGQKFCLHCCNYHRKDQPCYVQPIEPKGKGKPYRIVAYDFECSQHTRPDAEKEWYLHEVNFVCAQVTCSECIAKDRWKDMTTNDCKICGAMKEVTWSQAEGKNPLNEFVSWILYSFDKSYTTYAFAHYGGRYDMQLVVNEILRMGGLDPEVVRTGHKLYEVKVEKKTVVVQTYFRDSYCLMSQPLGDLVDAYKLGIEEKQFFPHLYNKPANYKRRLRHLPKRKYYSPDTMKPEKRKQFKAWYRQHKNTPFFLPDKLREYCCNDVQILMHALVAFRREWVEVCQDDVLQNSMTIASACMRTYRTHHLQPESLALSPELGYERHDKQSVVALKYLKWYAKTNGVNVRHRDSPGGEYKLECVNDKGEKRKFSLDGYVERPGQRPLAIEFNGCAYHGCNKCYRDDTLCPNGKTALLNREVTEEREALIRQHMDLHVVWECQVNAMLREPCKCKCEECDKCKGRDKCECSMQQFFKDELPWGPIDPRDAYFGGRTGPTKMRAKPRQGRQLSYFDIQSLYPATNFYTEYPLGVPTVIVRGEPVRWTSADALEYKGLYKVLVLPPTDLLHPVLPVKFDDRLLFPLCRTCAVDYEKKSTRVSGYQCTHTDEQRSFACTVTHLELAEALRHGYTVTYIDRAWHWERWSADVFKPYVRQFMKLKIEASGWPEHITTDEQKQLFIEENERVYGIRLDPDNIRKNKAKRQIAKLCLNSLWGRFSMRNNLAKTVITSRPDVFCDIAFDERLVLNSVEMVSDETVHLTYTHKKDFVEENPSSNIFVSLFTTSAARLRLYEYISHVSDHPKSELLYTDTDSIIYEHPVGDNPVAVGEYLGQMTDEYPKHTILEYYSGGAKQYALKLKSNTDGKISHLLKLRGITLNYKTKKSITFRKFKQQVLQYGQIDPIFVDVSRFELSKTGTIHTIYGKKQYRAVNQKGIITEKYEIVPFGYRGKY